MDTQRNMSCSTAIFLKVLPQISVFLTVTVHKAKPPQLRASSLISSCYTTVFSKWKAECTLGCSDCKCLVL